LIRLNVQYFSSDTLSKVILNNKKQIEVSNATGIICPPYRRGALKRYPNNRIVAIKQVNKQKAPPIYLIFTGTCFSLARIPTHVLKNKKAVIGDIRPI
jgi:hypothetical protein